MSGISEQPDARTTSTSTVEDAAVSCRNLTRVFRRGIREVTAVSDLTLNVYPGSIFGLLGPNGAGKTTTVRMLTGQLPPTSGIARVAGCDIRADRKRLHSRIGVVFDQPNLYDQLTGRQNLRLFARLHGASEDRVEPVLEQVDMLDAADRRFKSYSKGMKQRMVMARALLHKPTVLFLDEPTSGLDPLSQASIRDIIFQVASRGATVLLTTHDMHLADRLCSEVAILDRGRLVASGSPSALKSAQGESRILVNLADGRRMEFALTAPDTPRRLSELLSSQRVCSIETQAPSLEDVFLALTGRRLS